jgi:class 3 adenylate cyclase
MDSPREVVAGYRAILFLDLVESCALKARLGEERFFDEIESPYLEILQKALAAAPCRERNDTGDGKLLTFDRVEDAVTAALLIQGYLRSAPWRSDRPQVRIGIHGGSTRILRGGEIRGNNVDLCARLTAIALPGQILLTRHAYDEARRFVRGHPPLDGQTDRPELSWRAHGSYPFKGFADRCEVCEIGAYGDAPLEAPAMPGAAGTADKALKLVENLGRFARRNPVISIVAAIAIVVLIPLLTYYAWSAAQQLPHGTTLPGEAISGGKLHESEQFTEDDEAWFVRIVERYQQDAEDRTDPKRGTQAHAVVFLSKPLPFSQATLEISSDRYQEFRVFAKGFLVRGDGWVQVLSSRDTTTDGMLTFRFANVKRGDQLRVIVFAETHGGNLPHPSGLTFKVL